MAQVPSVWSSRLASGLRVAWACVMVRIALQFGNAGDRRLFDFPVFAYVTVIMITGDATVGDAMQGAAFAFYGTLQGVFPAMISLRLIGPTGFSVYTTALMVAISSFLVALPRSSSVVSKRVALAQIVIVYIKAYMGNMKSFTQPLHVAMSTMLGASASILAVLIPFPRLASCEVQENTKLLAKILMERMKLLIDAAYAENSTSAIASISHAKSIAKTGNTLLQNIKKKQASIGWERPSFIFSPPIFRIPDRKLKDFDCYLTGMEMALSSSPSLPMKTLEELRILISSLNEKIILRLDLVNHSKNSITSSPTHQLGKEALEESFESLSTIFPCYQDLQAFFFLLCMKLLYVETTTTQAPATPTEEIKDLQQQKSAPTMMKKILSCWFMTIDNGRLIAALKCSLSTGLSVLLGVLYRKDNGFWAGLAVALCMLESREPTFKMANVRAQGTILGSIYGVLICFLAKRWMVLRFLGLLPWVVFTNFLRHSEMYGHAGGISAFIAAVLILARKNNLPPSEFAIDRITETFIGAACSILVELVLQPTRASSLARTQLSSTLEILHECIGSVVSANSDKSPVEKLRIHVLELTKFVEEAKVEPSFWFLPFPSATYNRLLGSMPKMVELLLFVSHSLEFLQEISCRSFGVISWKELQEPINGDLENFKNVICSSMKCLEEVTRIKSLSKLTKELKKKNGSSDLEAGGNPKASRSVNLLSDDGEMEKIVDSFLQHASEVITKSDEKDLKGQMMLCLSGLGFCIRSMIKETKEIEKGIQELLQWENPSSNLNVCEISYMVKSMAS